VSTPGTLSDDEWDTIAVRVLNAGVEEGAATFVTGVLRQSGFAPLDPRDGPENVEATMILYGDGREVEAATVNAVIEAAPDNVIQAPEDDPSWAEFGAELDVLVLLGPG
jgi:hypothetical protein